MRSRNGQLPTASHHWETAGLANRAAHVLMAGLFLAGGCASPAEVARLRLNNEELRTEKSRLERGVLDRDRQIAELQRQVENLKGFDDAQPADLFAPVKIEIASLSGGANYDDKPGDDGVTVHLRPLDEDGYVVKVPGRITVQLTDLTDPSSPRLLGVCVVGDANTLRESWYGRFGTNHYTIKCPFASDVALPASRTVVVRAEFVDYLTGKTLTAVKEVKMAIPDSQASSTTREED